MNRTLSRLVFIGLCASSIGARTAWAQSIAYEVPEGTVGNQEFGGTLGMSFLVLDSITITHLGSFDSGSDGLNRSIPVSLWDRDNLATGPVASVTFPTGLSGIPLGGSQFLDITPLSLPPGFRGTIVAENYGAGEPNGNQGVGPLPLTTDSGGGRIHFEASRFGFTAGAFPDIPDGPPANRYAAGTFVFEPGPPLPPIHRDAPGDWIGRYGSEGFILSNFDGPLSGVTVSPHPDRAALPEYVSSYAVTGLGYVWDDGTLGANTDPRAVVNPDDTGNRRATTWFDGAGFDVTVQVDRPVDFKLAAYFLDWDSFTRNQEISFPGRAIDTLVMDDFNGGKWSQWDIHADPANPLVMHLQNLTGANAVLSALMFDPIPEPGTCGLALAALAAACLVAVKRAKASRRV